MRLTERLLGPTVHPLLVALPIGAVANSIAWDGASLATHDAVYAAVGFWSLTLGLVAALVAGVPGLLDYLTLPRGTSARAIAAAHSFVHLSALGVFLAGWALRAHVGPSGPPGVALLFSVAGIAIVVAGGFLSPAPAPEARS